ncbi:MAG: hypothetical protein HOW73_09110 [Polyangiaceae bacterium]|nr:hypothetical protein [Polyangiaceae bacterium]
MQRRSWSASLAFSALVSAACSSHNASETPRADASAPPSAAVEKQLPAPASRPATGKALNVRANQSVACAALASGDVACWGADTLGVGGINAREPGSVPLFFDGVNDATRVVPLGWATCALGSKGPILCWGPGQAPTPLPGTEGARDIADSDFGVCVVLGSGKIACLDPSKPDVAPTMVAGVDHAVSLTQKMWGRTCAVLDTGKVSCWGDLDEIGLGKENAPATLYPGIDDATAVVHYEQSTTCVVRRSGAVSCKTTLPELPKQIPTQATQLPEEGPGRLRCHRDGGAVLCSQRWDEPPTKMALSKEAVDLGCSSAVCCATLADGSVECLGNNDGGLLGDGAPLVASTPQLVKGIPPASRIAVGHQLTLAVTREGDVYVWGWYTGMPQKLYLSGRAVDVDANEVFGLVRLADGSLRMVSPDENRFQTDLLPSIEGEILDSSIDDNRNICAAVKDKPVVCSFHQDEQEGYRAIKGSEGVVSLSAIGNSTCGLRADKKVVCMVDHRFDPDEDFAQGPVQPMTELVSGLANVTWLATPYAIVEGGDVVRINKEEGAKTFSLIPEPMKKGAAQYTDGGFGWSPGCILRAGALECWKGSSAIAKLQTDFGPTAVVAGNDHACALGKEGTVHCWGKDTRGGLGQGRKLFATVPMRVVGLGP